MLSGGDGYPGRDLAIAGIGIALIVVLAGLCTIVALAQPSVHELKELASYKELTGYLVKSASALSGGLLGLLAPAPSASAAASSPLVEGLKDNSHRAFLIAAKDMWSNRTVVMLFVVFVVAATLAGSKSTELQALAAASGGALVGLLAPLPSKKTQEDK